MPSPRQLVLDLLARDKTGPATKGAADNLKTVGDAAADAAKDTEKLVAQSDKAEDQVEKFGKSARSAAEHVEDLDREIENVERELRQLAVAWKEAESAAERADLSKAIRRTERDLKQLNKNKGVFSALIPKPAEIAEAGAETGRSFIKSFMEVAQSGPAGAGAAVGAGLAAAWLAPALGATVSAGILGGVGIGGVIGGLSLAKRDTRVKAATKSLGDEVTKSLDRSAGVFVPVALKGIQQIRASFGRIDDDLTGIFETSSRYVQPLINGVTGLVERAIGGVSEAVAAAGPVIDVLERQLPNLGAVIGDVLSNLADNGPEAAVALDQVFTVIEGGVVTLGAVVNGLTEAYGFLASLGVFGEDAMRAWAKYTKEAKNAGDETDVLAGKQEELKRETDYAAEAARGEQKALEGLAKQLRAQTDPVFGLLTAEDRLTEAQKKAAEATKKHGANSKEAQTALRELTVRALEVQAAAGALGNTFDGKLTPELIGTLRAAGLTEDQIAAVGKQFRQAKKDGDKFAKHYKAKISVEYAGALAGSAAVNIGRLLTGRAAGGPVTKGVPYIVGENRPEVFVPESNGRIAPSVGQYAASMSASGGGNGGWVVVRGDAIIDALTVAIASRVSAKGGRPAQLGIRFG